MPASRFPYICLGAGACRVNKGSLEVPFTPGTSEVVSFTHPLSEWRLRSQSAWGLGRKGSGCFLLTLQYMYIVGVNT